MSGKKELLEIAQQEHDPRFEVKKVMPYGWDGTNVVAQKVNSAGELMMSSLVPEKYDEIVLGYDGGGNLTSVIYKFSTATIATLTLSYTGSNLTNVIRS